MRIATTETKVYRYHELSESAKERVKNEYLLDNEVRVMDFEDDIMDDLENNFPESDLHVQFSFSGCQGDGLNVYGLLDPMDVVNASVHLEILTEDEARKMKEYITCYSRPINLSENRWYTYSLTDSDAEYGVEDFVEEYMEELRAEEVPEDKMLLQKFIENVYAYIRKFERTWQDAGWNYFYEIDDEEMNDICEANDWEFEEDGKYFFSPYEIIMKEANT